MSDFLPEILMYRFGQSIALLAILCLPASAQPDKPAANRMPIPEAAEIEQAETAPSYP